MSVKNGYIIPENPSPETNRCVRVYVPNDPLYMAALLGTLTYLGQWTAWERDALHRGTLAADSWKDANDLTLDGLSLPCGDNPITDEEMNQILEQLAEIRSQLAEINDMNVTVTQTVNGGCGCGDGTTITTNTTDGIIIDPEDTGIIPPYMTDTIQVANSARCRAANWMAVEVAQITRTMSTVGTMPFTLSNIVGVLISIFTIGNGLIWSMTAILALGYRLVNGLDEDSFDYFDTVADAMENSMETFVCALYNWTSATNLGAMLNSAMLGYVNDAQAQLGFSNDVANSLIGALTDVIGSSFVNYFVTNIDTIVPADFVPQHDCNCGATGDSCPTQNIVLAGFGTLPSGDLTGTTQGFGSSFNSDTGYYEVIFELTDNYCVTIDNGQYVGELTPTSAHETCAGGVMVPSDGSCIRRFVERSQTPFATAVTFTEQTVNCDCEIGCDTSFFGAYSDYYASIMCYERIDVPVFVANRGEFGQQYEIVGRDIRLFGTNHPGLETVGIDVDLGVRPHNAVALAFTVELAGDLVKGAMVTPSDAGQSLLISSGGDTGDGVKSLFYDTVVSYNSTFKNAWGVEANKLRLFGVGGMQIGLISDIASASLGKTYDITFTDIAWLIDTRF